MPRSSDQCAAAAAGGPCEDCRRLFERLERRLMEMEVRLSGLERQKQSDQLTPQVFRPTGKWRVTEDTPCLAEYFKYRTCEFEQSRDLCRLSIVRDDFLKAAEPCKVNFVSGDTLQGREDFVREYGVLRARKEKYEIGAIKMQQRGDVLVLNLVAKDKSSRRLADNPEQTLTNIVSALEALKSYCVQRKVKRLAMDRFFATFERVHWRWTQRKMLDIFAGVDIHLVVYMQARRKNGLSQDKQFCELVQRLPLSPSEKRPSRPLAKTCSRRSVGKQTSPSRAEKAPFELFEASDHDAPVLIPLTGSCEATDGRSRKKSTSFDSDSEYLRWNK